MKTLYICGDSFSTPDPEYGTCWVDLLEKSLAGRAQVINLSSVSASNLLISIQCQQAIIHRANFVIVHATTVTRGEVAVEDSTSNSLWDRFDQDDLVSFSIFRPYRSALTSAQQHDIQNFYSKYFDLNLAIYRDQCIIENTLDRLVDSGIPFLFDQGGFEHVKFAESQKIYFENWNQYRSAVNLWDHGETAEERPHFHIKDPHIHQEVADYYAREIGQYL